MPTVPIQAKQGQILLDVEGCEARIDIMSWQIEHLVNNGCPLVEVTAKGSMRPWESKASYVNSVNSLIRRMPFEEYGVSSA